MNSIKYILRIIFISFLLSASFYLPASNECSVTNNGNIISSPTILSGFPKCWRGQFEKYNNVFLTHKNNDVEVNIPWSTCEYYANGFRNEIRQAFYHKYNPFEDADSWGIEDEDKYPSVNYSWDFKIEDNDNLIGSWAKKIIIAQWHSYSSPLDRHKYRGGSPVIGLFYTKPRSEFLSKTGKLTLFAKVLRNSGHYCNDALPTNNPSFCMINIAETNILESEFNNINLQIEWNKNINSPGRINALINNKPFSPLLSSKLIDGSAYVIPTKQNALPNYLKLGLYVGAQKKKKIYRKWLKSRNENKKPDFCDSSKKINLVIRRFKFNGFKSSE